MVWLGKQVEQVKVLGGGAVYIDMVFVLALRY